MAADGRPYEPPMLTRVLSNATMGGVGFLCRNFLYALNSTEVHGLDAFLDLLKEREDPSRRERGLITVSNHVSVYNGLISGFFSLGNTLPIHRIAHSSHGGLFQPTMTQVIRLLSDPHGQPSESITGENLSSYPSFALDDPFTSSQLTYTTTGTDSFPAPSAYPSNRHAWIHIFPEGRIHQHPQKTIRYFKWGVARLILESEPCPDVVPMWIDGFQDVMDGRRGWPKPIPRPGKQVGVWFGERVDHEAVFGSFRERWRSLVDRAAREMTTDENHEGTSTSSQLGIINNDELRYSKEAEQLRIEVTAAVRNEVLKIRRRTGLPDEDPKSSLAATWREEGNDSEGEKKDGSLVQDQ
ncbi:hypothetical protein B0A48_05267 [Cryoendolithus antarcticus]|uniref:Tafazzin family protein n=1 Tax=Cryoendolithus antarcticus TaxID=1507870 RepID=A0A1V8TIF1_9PEZI|nr:hypothetical protein B0A48_05267 [Cryoendolithus antarcticus]